jgi:pantothenate kinase-related protein Tda10
VGNDFSNPFLQKEKLQMMKSQQQRVPCSGVPVNSNVPNTQLAPLKEVVDRVNSAVEVTTREFQCLTSWLLHREEHRQKESCGFPHLKGREDRQSSATEGR